MHRTHNQLIESYPVAINSIKEYAGKGRQITGYLVQGSLNRQCRSEFLRIELSLFDHETKEKGEGCLFLNAPDWW